MCSVELSMKRIITSGPGVHICQLSAQQRLRPQGYQTFFHAQLNQAEISNAHKNWNAEIYKIIKTFELSDVVFIMLINVKMPTIVGILTFMSMINFSWDEHEKSVIISNSGLTGMMFRLIWVFNGWTCHSVMNCFILSHKMVHFTRLFPAISGKGPWPKLGKHDRLNIKIGRN